jgi:sulfate transport system permease protein
VLAFARAISEYGSLVLLSGNLQFRTEVAAVRIYGFNQDGNRGSASAIAAILLVVALIVIVVLDVLQRRVARRDS